MQVLDNEINELNELIKNTTDPAEKSRIQADIFKKLKSIAELFDESRTLQGEPGVQETLEGMQESRVESVSRRRLKQIDEEIAALELVMKDATMSEEEIAVATSKIAELKFEANDIWNTITSEADDPNTPSERELTGERLTEPSPDLDDAELTMLDEGNKSVDDLGLFLEYFQKMKKK